MGAAVDVSDAPGSLGGGDGDPSHVVRTPHTVGGGVAGDGQRSGGLPPRASSPAGPTADPRSRCLAQTRDRGAETGTGDVPSTSATTVAANATNPVTSQSLRRRIAGLHFTAKNFSFSTGNPMIRALLMGLA